MLLSLPRHAANYCSSGPGPGIPFSMQCSLTPSQCVRRLGLCNKAPPSQRRTAVTGCYCSVVSQPAQLVWTGLAGWAHPGSAFSLLSSGRPTGPRCPGPHLVGFLLRAQGGSTPYLPSPSRLAWACSPCDREGREREGPEVRISELRGAPALLFHSPGCSKASSRSRRGALESVL